MGILNGATRMASFYLILILIMLAFQSAFAFDEDEDYNLDVTYIMRCSEKCVKFSEVGLLYDQDLDSPIMINMISLNKKNISLKITHNEKVLFEALCIATKYIECVTKSNICSKGKIYSMGDKTFCDIIIDKFNYIYEEVNPVIEVLKITINNEEFIHPYYNYIGWRYHGQIFRHSKMITAIKADIETVEIQAISLLYFTDSITVYIDMYIENNFTFSIIYTCEQLRHRYVTGGIYVHNPYYKERFINIIPLYVSYNFRFKEKNIYDDCHCTWRHKNLYALDEDKILHIFDFRDYYFHVLSVKYTKAEAHIKAVKK